jgi:2,3-bisphosphoglycerate-dependent phosphoglycerate mutase
MELYFIRHGQSQNNANWGNPDYRENPDPALTDLGVEQACLVAEFLKNAQAITNPQRWNIQNRLGFGLTHIYTSLMERAVYTAAPTARALGLPFAAWEEIHESGGIFGRDGEVKLKGLPGKSRDYFEKHFPELGLPDHLDGTGWWNRPFETEEGCYKRAEKFLSDLIARHGDRDGQPEQRVAIFSHGGFFVHLMFVILKTPWRQGANGMRSWFMMNNCAISRIDFDPEGTINIAYLNRTDHLPDHLIT